MRGNKDGTSLINSIRPDENTGMSHRHRHQEDEVMKVFDAEALRQEVEARRSRSNQSTPLSAEDEDVPVQSGYSMYPPLDRTTLRGGYKLCIENAERLLTDAKALAEAGRYRSAHRILLSVLEELGTALQLYEAGRAGVQDWAAWWRGYYSQAKDLQSARLGIAKREEPDAPLSFVPTEIAHVKFDKKRGGFTAPIDDESPELVAFFEKELAYTENVLKRLPSHAFERLEYELLIEQSPKIGPLVLYACIEEVVSQEPSVSEKDLLTAIAKDLSYSRDVLAAGFEKWKEVSPRARAYVDLIRHVYDHGEPKD